MSKEIEIVPDQPIVTPADADRVAEMIKAFDYFKAKVLTDRDICEIQNKPYVKKSGWSKYALACNVSTEVKDERTEERNGSRIYHFTYRAIHLPSGRFAEAVGSASEAEKKTWNHPEHDIRTLAQTRAFNRAISNLVGGGEVSAEEMQTNSTPPPRRSPIKEVPVTKVNVTMSPGQDEDAVMAKLARAGLMDSDRVTVYKYGKQIYVKPSQELAELWDSHDKALAAIGAVWVDDAGRWEIPLEA